MTRQKMAEQGRVASLRALYGPDADLEKVELEDYESGMVDALTNLMHFADLYNLDFEQQLTRAYTHHKAELEFDWEEETA